MLFNTDSSTRVLKLIITKLMHACMLSSVCLISACNNDDNDFAELEALESVEQQQAETARRSQITQNSASVYITSWGHSYSHSAGTFWAHRNIQLSNGDTIYAWAQKQGNCYQVNVQGAFLASANNCYGNLNDNWQIGSCTNHSGSTYVNGDHIAALKSMVAKCAY